MLAIVGALLVAMGLFSGGVLLAAEFGLGGLSAGATLWVLFPLFSIAGYVLFVVGAGNGPIRRMSGLLAGLLLLLATAAAIGLVLAAASVLTPAGSTLSLWYVLAVAGVLGAVGAAALRMPQG
ncbi:MAG TPA: hypothetical protein VLI72_08485 [Methylibium sp.]|nr:hypothetical protein [Methylibium sp.]